MLKRIYIDNFRCLVNFELDFDAINLFLGANGSGKSTVFEVLQKIQAFISGDSKVEGIFKPADFTRWQTLQIQRFELEILGNDGCYTYQLQIDEYGDKCRVRYESLLFDNRLLLQFEFGEVQLYRDDYSPGPKMPRNDNTKLTWFRERMARFIIVQVVPSLMVDESSQEQMRLTPKMENFVSWYRYLSEDQGKVAEIGNILKDVLNGFNNFKFDRVSEDNLVLKNIKPIEYRLRELSDGQKTLVALYALIHGTKSEDYTLWIDEPENFLALPEIQPWLIELYDLCNEGKLQALLISHHPELINYLLASPIGYWFERQSNAAVRVKRISSEVADNSGLPVSELIARGWLNESA
ncbi:MAG: ATP-binding cassette domain-containing protein [Oscillatoriales cyanobacterium]|nr:MAG: ATP-binding cassette domain-containing protein [Oscillatoriales cyanobacterium]